MFKHSSIKCYLESSHFFYSSFFYVLPSYYFLYYFILYYFLLLFLLVFGHWIIFIFCRLGWPRGKDEHWLWRFNINLFQPINLNLSWYLPMKYNHFLIEVQWTGQTTVESTMIPETMKKLKRERKSLSVVNQSAKSSTIHIQHSTIIARKPIMVNFQLVLN